MASVISQSIPLGPIGDHDYPTTDGRPMGETDLHRNVMFDTIETLKLYFSGQLVYVTGNLLLFYEEGNRRRHVSPDCFVVRGLEHRNRKNFLLWKEGKSPNIVIEITSASTREEDIEDKMRIYCEEVKANEYFLFDPWQEYLTPSLQGHRLSGGKYIPVTPIADRLPSIELGLHLEAAGTELRFHDPATGQWVPTWKEARWQAEKAAQQAEKAAQQAEKAAQQAEKLAQQAEKVAQQSEKVAQQATERVHQAEERLRQEAVLRQQADGELARLRRELEELRRKSGGGES